MALRGTGAERSLEAVVKVDEEKIKGESRRGGLVMSNKDIENI